MTKKSEYSIRDEIQDALGLRPMCELELAKRLSISRKVLVRNLMCLKELDVVCSFTKPEMIRSPDLWKETKTKRFVKKWRNEEILVSYWKIKSRSEQLKAELRKLLDEVSG